MSWPLRKIDDVAIFLNARRKPVKAADRAKRQGPYPYYGASGIVDWVDDYIFDGEYLLISEDGENLRSRNSPIAFIASGKYWVNNHAHILDEREPGILRYLSWSLNRTDLSPYITGAAQPKLNKRTLSEIKVAIPPLEERLTINAILGALDDKIELNRRMAATLEEMARALYRSWFVDFDPVKAKADGQMPAFMDEETAALFPNRFGDNGLPEGWVLRSLGDFFKFQRGLSYKGKFLTESGSPMINLGCFIGGGRFDPTKIKNYSGETKERNWVQPGDLVFANTDMTQNRLILGSPHIVEGKPNEAFLYSHHVFAGRPTSNESRIWTRFIFFQLLQPEFRERAEGFATGTTVLFLPADAAEALSFPAPELPLIHAFNSQTDPWLKRSQGLRSENQTLTILRDTLLPKLMSGELRVGEAKEQIEEVA
ncbi:restriction endonuclease subunit S [Saliniramus fredricksonii]|uniref:Type I restriction enzyme, S subunit n=1 Tax=Saliniramus fredricksonii TaxID=1653334 RepID=A0ABY0K5C8_9HYPH|nr:restriction endonuclease subunit S [Saliniramus fredricksonii]SCC78473.1 type I restriction enzyme, S subunit [Saliniramus fredricksonii]